MSFLFTFSLPHLPFGNPFSTQNREQHDSSERQWRSREYDDGNEVEMRGSSAFLDPYQYRNTRNSSVEPNYTGYRRSQAPSVDTPVDNPRKRKKADENYHDIRVSRDYAPQRSSRRHPRRQSRNTSGYRTMRHVHFEYHNIPGKLSHLQIPCNHRDTERTLGHTHVSHRLRVLCVDMSIELTK
jgi:hypothetical protein